MSAIKEMARGMARAAMLEGGNLALDSCVRLLGKLVEKYTIAGKPHEAMGAAGAMEMVKELRKHSPSLYGDQRD